VYQGDITAILDASGTAVVRYTYDAWGKLLTTTGSMASTLGVHNPLRYRGYVYDNETSLYYLQSRYYDPAMGRFINADGFASTGQGILGNNMFAYCCNNPIIRADSAGNFFFTVLGAAIGAVVGAVDAALMGGSSDDIVRGALSGAASGAIAGAGVDIAVAVTAASGGTAVAAGVAIAGAFGAVGSIVGTGISNNWEGDPVEYLSAGIVGGITNVVSFGLAPMNGEIVKGTATSIMKGIFREGVKDFGMNAATGSMIAAAATCIHRVMSHER